MFLFIFKSDPESDVLEVFCELNSDVNSMLCLSIAVSELYPVPDYIVPCYYDTCLHHPTYFIKSRLWEYWFAFMLLTFNDESRAYNGANEFNIQWYFDSAAFLVNIYWSHLLSLSYVASSIVLQQVFYGKTRIVCYFFCKMILFSVHDEWTNHQPRKFNNRFLRKKFPVNKLVQSLLDMM